MAGNYPDAPSRRFAYDADGTVFFFLWSIGSGSVTYNNLASQSTLFNNESEDTYAPRGGDSSRNRFEYGHLFPEAREIDGIYVAKGSNSNMAPLNEFATSIDTTSAWDGTYVTQIADLPDYTYVNPGFRNSIQSTAVSNVVGTKIVMDGGLYYNMKCIHVYGTFSPGSTPDRLLYLDTENADAVFSKVLDYGDVPRGQTSQRTIKIKNNSSGKTINTIQITAEDLTANAGGFFTFSVDDNSYQATLNLGNLGPGDTQPVYVKQSIPDGESLGLQTGRFRLAHASLT